MSKRTIDNVPLGIKKAINLDQLSPIYSAFSYGIQSNMALNLPRYEKINADIKLWFMEKEHLKNYLNADPERWLFLESEIADTYISKDGEEVCLNVFGMISHELLHAYLFGIVITHVLHYRKCVTLHGSLVSDGKKGIGFIGSSGNGKSSLAMALLRKGFCFLSDDLLPLRLNIDHVQALPTMAFARLCRDSIEYFSMPKSQEHRILGIKPKFSIAEEILSQHFSPDPVALKTIYILKRKNGVFGIQETCETQKEIIIQMLSHTWALQIDERESIREQLHFFRELSKTVHVHSLYIPESIEKLGNHLPELIKHIGISGS